MRVCVCVCVCVCVYVCTSCWGIFVFMCMQENNCVRKNLSRLWVSLGALAERRKTGGNENDCIHNSVVVRVIAVSSLTC